MGLFSDILLALIAGGLSEGNGNKSSGNFVSSDPHSPEFIDYCDKWGSNNDHSWSADGDTRWDSYE